MKKELKKIAHKIVALEKEAQGQANRQYFIEMQKLTERLSIRDMIEIDDYIQSKNLLTK